MSDAYLVAAVRTPIGKYLGGLSELHAPELGGRVLKEILARANIPAGSVDEVIMGSVLQAGLGQNPARQAALKAGLPETIAAFTVNKVCGSGLKSVMLAAQAIRAGDADILLAGGMESMSRAPHLLFGTRTGWKIGDQKAVDAMIHDGLWCAYENWHMGEAAEHIATKCSIGRGEQDRFAVQSHQRAAQAWSQNVFNAEVMPIIVGSGPKAKTIAQDEGFRADSNPDALARLKPSFRGDGTVTAGNASMLSDGAAAVAVVSTRGLEKIGTKPMARVVAYATSGIAPKDIFLAPVGAVRMVLEKAKLAIGDIDLFELNEAFASQMLACNQDLRIDEAKINVHGGAIALGHPIGASGTRVLVTLLHALERRQLRFGLASLCLGGGNAVAMIVERLIMRTLAIGDIHGCLRAFDLLLEVVQPGPDDLVVTLGDYVDRGPDSKAVLNRLIDLQSRCRLVTLKGNHEIMMLEARDSPVAFSNWLGSGGKQALQSYDADPHWDSLVKAISPDHWRFLEACLPYHELDTHFFVHANAYPDMPLADQPDYMLFWENIDELQSPHSSGKTMICGHSAQRTGKPLVMEKAVCIDTWVYGDGWLTCLNVETGQYWQTNQKGKRDMRMGWLDEE